MSIELGPSVYRQGTKWDIKPKNIVDTVAMKVYVDTTTQATLDTHTVTSGRTPDGVNITLPLANNSEIVTRQKSMSNSRTYSNVTYKMGSATVSITTIKGSYTVTLQTPVKDVPTAQFTLNGTTHYTTRRATNVDTVDGLATVGAQANYIITNQNNEEALSNNASYDTIQRGQLKDGLLKDYNQGAVSLYPWIRKTTGNVPTGLTPIKLDQSTYKPDAADVFTNWFEGDQAGYGINALCSEWSNYGAQGMLRQCPINVRDSSATSEYGLIPITPDTYSIYCTVAKISDTEFRVSYELPVRYTYIAASKYILDQGAPVANTCDSYGFVDLISSISIELIGAEYSTDTVDEAFSLDEDDTLMDPVNNHPYSFSDNEFISYSTKWGSGTGDYWDYKMSTYLLQHYKNGKYVAKATVPAKWAIENNIHINSQISIRLQNNQLVTRGNNVCIFNVKTIEKAFQKNQFVYYLGLLEE